MCLIKYLLTFISTRLLEPDFKQAALPLLQATSELGTLPLSVDK